MTRPTSKQIKTISLFTGAGGLDIGFHAAGFDIRACVEIDRNYCDTLEANKGRGRTYGPSPADPAHSPSRRMFEERYSYYDGNYN